MLTVTIDNPAHAPGTKFSIRGLGEFENGVPKEIDPGTEESFLYITGRAVQDIGDEIVKVEGSPTIFEGSSTPPVEPLTGGAAQNPPGTDNGETPKDNGSEEPDTEEGSDT